MDKYRNFRELSLEQQEGIDYVVRVRWGLTGIAVMAPHGGRIELGTSEIARVLAGNGHTFYEFAGIRKSSNYHLHIRSERFDEPRALVVLERSKRVVVIHGCRGNKPVLYIGGQPTGFRDRIWRVLQKHGLPVASHPIFRGMHNRNLCNRNGNGVGVQLELSIALRKALLPFVFRTQLSAETRRFERMINALRCVLREESRLIR